MEVQIKLQKWKVNRYTEEGFLSHTVGNPRVRITYKKNTEKELEGNNGGVFRERSMQKLETVPLHSLVEASCSKWGNMKLTDFNSFLYTETPTPNTMIHIPVCT